MKRTILLGAVALAASVFSHAWAGGLDASGTVNSVDKSKRTVNISHGPIKSLDMGAMTMDFKVADPSMLSELKPGQGIHFSVEAGRGGFFVITDMEVEESHASN